LQAEGTEQAKADAVARQVETAFADHPHWQTSSHQEQELRKVLYKALIDGKVENVVEMAQTLMKMLRRGSA
jgi:hypothetical protein